ncbi:MAG: NifB/NifX family molybdenum-iron cluster-binding protein [Candidatus Methylomirabilota bacterium]
MKLCIPTLDDRGLAAPLSAHFGSAPYFTLVDTANGACEAHANGGTHAHGACSPVAALSGLRPDAVLCGGMGARAAALLLQAGIRPLLVEAATVGEAVAALAAGRVQELTPDRACAAHGCHS